MCWIGEWKATILFFQERLIYSHQLIQLSVFRTAVSLSRSAKSCSFPSYFLSFVFLLLVTDYAHFILVLYMISCRRSKFVFSIKCRKCYSCHLLLLFFILYPITLNDCSMLFQLFSSNMVIFLHFLYREVLVDSAVSILIPTCWCR